MRKSPRTTSVPPGMWSGRGKGASWRLALHGGKRAREETMCLAATTVAQATVTKQPSHSNGCLATVAWQPLPSNHCQATVAWQPLSSRSLETPHFDIATANFGCQGHILRRKLWKVSVTTCITRKHTPSTCHFIYTQQNKHTQTRWQK